MVSCMFIVVTMSETSEGLEKPHTFGGLEQVTPEGKDDTGVTVGTESIGKIPGERLAIKADELLDRAKEFGQGMVERFQGEEDQWDEDSVDGLRKTMAELARSKQWDESRYGQLTDVINEKTVALIQGIGSRIQSARDFFGDKDISFDPELMQHMETRRDNLRAHLEDPQERRRYPLLQPLARLTTRLKIRAAEKAIAQQEAVRLKAPILAGE